MTVQSCSKSSSTLGEACNLCGYDYLLIITESEEQLNYWLLDNFFNLKLKEQCTQSKHRHSKPSSYHCVGVKVFVVVK